MTNMTLTELLTFILIIIFAPAAIGIILCVIGMILSLIGEAIEQIITLIKKNDDDEQKGLEI